MECVYVDYCGVMVFVSVGRICVYMCMRVCVCGGGGGGGGNSVFVLIL